MSVDDDPAVSQPEPSVTLSALEKRLGSALETDSEMHDDPDIIVRASCCILLTLLLRDRMRMLHNMTIQLALKIRKRMKTRTWSSKKWPTLTTEMVELTRRILYLFYSSWRNDM